MLVYCALGEYQHKDLKTWLALKEPAILELIAIAVIPELRGTEAGPMLMAAVTTAFYESDFNVLYLEALGSHPKLIHYYADKYGFQLLVQAGRMVLLK